jgi:hypothetical protein
MNRNPTSAMKSVRPFPIHAILILPSFLQVLPKQRSSDTPSIPSHISSYPSRMFHNAAQSARIVVLVLNVAISLHRMMSDHRERLMESSRLRSLLGITSATSSGFSPAQSFPSFFVIRAIIGDELNHSSVDETLSMLGDGEESRVYLELKVGLAIGCCVVEIWPSVSTSSMGIRSIWRPTRLGM